MLPWTALGLRGHLSRNAVDRGLDGGPLLLHRAFSNLGGAHQESRELLQRIIGVGIGPLRCEGATKLRMNHQKLTMQLHVLCVEFRGGEIIAPDRGQPLFE